MKKNMVLFTAIAFFLGCSQSAPATERWGYVVNTSKISASYIASEIQKYSVISLTGFHITGKGSIRVHSTDLSKKIIKAARENNIRWYPLITFQSPGIGKRILSNKRLRDKVGDTLATWPGTVKCHGIHLDIEHISPGYSGYIPQLLKRIRAVNRNLTITMAIFPQVAYRSRRSKLHDLSLLSKHLDQVVLMCYDLHDTGTGPGPVSALKWSEENIIEVKKYFAPKKIWLGTPSYGYQWKNGKNGTAVSARYGMVLANRYGFVRNSSGNIHVTYSKGGNRYSVYFSDFVLRQQMHKLAERYNLAGIAFWRLGLEDREMLK